jgi:hypothetical protein
LRILKLRFQEKRRITVSEDSASMPSRRLLCGNS